MLHQEFYHVMVTTTQNGSLHSFYFKSTVCRTVNGKCKNILKKASRSSYGIHTLLFVMCVVLYSFSVMSTSLI